MADNMIADFRMNGNVAQLAVDRRTPPGSPFLCRDGAYVNMSARFIGVAPATIVVVLYVHVLWVPSGVLCIGL